MYDQSFNQAATFSSNQLVSGARVPHDSTTHALGPQTRIRIGAPASVLRKTAGKRKRLFKSVSGDTSDQMALTLVGGRTRKRARGGRKKIGKRKSKRATGGRKKKRSVTKRRTGKAFTIARKGRIRVTVQGRSRLLSASAVLKHVAPATIAKAAQAVRRKRPKRR